MRGFLAVFERELAERRLLAAAAVGFGVVAVVLPLLPAFQRSVSTPAELRGGLALALAMLLSALTAVYLGGSVLASDLLERRLGFYFARPLSGWALWAGKIAAAVVLTLGGGLLVLVPAALFGGELSAGGYWSLGMMETPEAFLYWAAGLLFLLFGTNALSVMVRSRSPWIALDMVALTLVGGLAWDARNRLIFAGVDPSRRPHGINSLEWFANAWILVPLAVVTAASAVQVLRGRTDVRRAHRALSGVLWGLLLAFGIVFQGFTFWMVSAGPEDLVGVTQVVGAPSGSSSWIAMVGPAVNRSGYSPGFLYDVASGRAVRAGFGPVSRWWPAPVRISADGRRAVWLEFQERPFDSPLVLYRLDLEHPGARPARTTISYRDIPGGLALSPDGRRVAAILGGRLTVDDVETGHLLGSVPLDGSPKLAFVAPDRIRLYQLPEVRFLPGRTVGGPMAAFDILELDLATGRTEATGRLSGVHEASAWTLSPDGSRMILRTGSRLQLRDARTGELLASLGAGEQASASFLAGGRIAVPVPGASWELQILAPDGTTELRRFRFPGARELVLVDEPAPGKLRIVTSRTGEPRSPWEARLLDLETGGAQHQGTRELALLAPPRSHGSRLSLQDKQGVVWREPFTLQERVVLKDALP